MNGINVTYNNKHIVGVLGTGDFARAITKRLIMSGYSVYMGSRCPQDRKLTEIDKTLEDAHVVSNHTCLTHTDIKILILAVPHDAIFTILQNYRDFLTDKILVDVSNRTEYDESESLAEILADAFPEAEVVKAFNTLSAYAIESDSFGGSRRVLIASNNKTASTSISELCHDMGFSTLNMGGLRNARELECRQLVLMSGWGAPTLFTFAVFFFWFAMCAIEFGIFFGTHPELKVPFGNLPLSALNKPVCLTAITLLALSYLPGCLASFLQICRGTKYKRFPHCMDRWMKSRKMLGLFALLFSCWHVVISAIILSPASMPEWYQHTRIHIPTNTTNFAFEVSSRMNWIGETSISVGLLGLIFMSILGLTSVPSISNTLNWQEWRFFQSKLGYVTLFFVTVHVLVMAVPFWIKEPAFIAISNRFYCILLPALVFIMKFLLLIPYVDRYLMKIRSGWERRLYHTHSNGYVHI
ncbi:metalloreductase STEAP4-like [Octopus sinensis]|uniref:Metalloreductase STEAP4-like n=1 Tax=Octopus sinensis TaxID=2607531 RepID=A0A7E6FT89_9MOLL|nr:metalloreductase STEAP4-like [Octopus sinensis]XP_036370789.1 metalloreductase STEAP4-like [Octopus sinensis]